MTTLSGGPEKDKVLRSCRDFMALILFFTETQDFA